MAKKRLTREDILNAKDIVQEEVYVKEWGGSVLVQSMSGKKRSEIMDYATDSKGNTINEKLYPALMVAGVVDPQFSRADAEALLSKNSAALEKISKSILRLSGVGEEEETEKNS